MRRVLGLAPYRRLLLAYTLNELAWSVGSIALAYLVYRRTGSALGAAGFFIVSQVLPALVAPALVARIDRRPAHRLLAALYLGEAVAFAALALVARHFSLAPVLAFALADGILAMTARPIARAATVSVTAAEGLLREGNALTNATFSVAYMVGPGIGGAMVASGGASVALLVNTGLFTVMAAALATCRTLPAPEAEDPEPARGRLRRGLAYARSHPAIRTLLSIQMTSVVAFTIAVPVEVVYAQHSLHAGARGYGGLLSAWGAGALAGSVVYARWRMATARYLVALSTALLGAGFLGMAAAPTLAPALVAAAAAGAGNAIQSVAARTALQEATPTTWMALVMSFNDSLGQAAPGAGIVLGGALAALVGARPTLAIGGAASLTVAAVIWLLLHPRRGLMHPVTDASSM